ncbi:hypothetical protein WT92_21505 [Burkholderia stagnalis]|uniref:Uncharacterized protein n=1 Tax=Burkholderia stagnalis TaxID=1503054 RepID=A0A107AI97_9BURK|nr:hypothetical protein WT35_27375 [Burkholderia stagnalis]KWA45002.1 hypothetical protein WT42_29780 [Burkholderia stagnalis]KWA53117.1 hypothetical protein WT44_30155 [Burkholderia stagnalis]KWA57961.1 hypothetical protein WT43_00600 [Burkholderia stagnalis]KWD02162.1 hypothetical protein WT45_10680 [Burkholderia stagnalis]
MVHLSLGEIIQLFKIDNIGELGVSEGCINDLMIIYAFHFIVLFACWGYIYTFVSKKPFKFFFGKVSNNFLHFKVLGWIWCCWKYIEF